MKELSDKEIKRFNYTKVKEYVEDELSYLTHLGTKLFCLLPPGAGRQISFLEKVDGTIQNGSRQEKYVEKKDYLERQIKEELMVFEELYIFQTTVENLEEKTGWSKNKVVHIKKSFMIKFSLSMGMDFEK